MAPPSTDPISVPNSMNASQCPNRGMGYVSNKHVKIWSSEQRIPHPEVGGIRKPGERRWHPRGAEGWVDQACCLKKGCL